MGDVESLWDVHFYKEQRDKVPLGIVDPIDLDAIPEVLLIDSDDDAPIKKIATQVEPIMEPIVFNIQAQKPKMLVTKSRSKKKKTLLKLVDEEDVEQVQVEAQVPEPRQVQVPERVQDQEQVYKGKRKRKLQQGKILMWVETLLAKELRIWVEILLMEIIVEELGIWENIDKCDFEFRDLVKEYDNIFVEEEDAVHSVPPQPTYVDARGERDAGRTGSGGRAERNTVGGRTSARGGGDRGNTRGVVGIEEKLEVEGGLEEIQWEEELDERMLEAKLVQGEVELDVEPGVEQSKLFKLQGSQKVLLMYLLLKLQDIHKVYPRIVRLFNASLQLEYVRILYSRTFSVTIDGTTFTVTRDNIYAILGFRPSQYVEVPRCIWPVSYYPWTAATSEGEFEEDGVLILPALPVMVINITAQHRVYTGSGIVSRKMLDDESHLVHSIAITNIIPRSQKNELSERMKVFPNEPEDTKTEKLDASNYHKSVSHLLPVLPYEPAPPGEHIGSSSSAAQPQESAIMDTGDSQSLYHASRDYYEGMNMRLDQQIPMLLVERQTLNKAIEGEKNGFHHMSGTRGLCLSEEQTVTNGRLDILQNLVLNS
ncbi:hypothetical protein GIB67_003458 [Kingdonia uniflora]|uniref:Protein DA1-like domain-containing protein n=1 Tax=Kingdonia uniflora TaxID=39325 RepID=A0A7J7P9F1_9MAGN|nr:hypothetical protein GIB67_003458 [Kingdonia uniflora]